MQWPFFVAAIAVTTFACGDRYHEYSCVDDTCLRVESDTVPPADADPDRDTTSPRDVGGVTDTAVVDTASTDTATLDTLDTEDSAGDTALVDAPPPSDTQTPNDSTSGDTAPWDSATDDSGASDGGAEDTLQLPDSAPADTLISCSVPQPGTELCDSAAAVWQGSEAEGCCFDPDHDGFGVGCGAGIDCYPCDPTRHSIPVDRIRLAQLITDVDALHDGYDYQFLACHQVVVLDTKNFIDAAPTIDLDVEYLRAMNPTIRVLVYVNVAATWESSATAHGNPLYGAWWDSLPREALTLPTTTGEEIAIWPIPPDPESPLRLVLMNLTPYIGPTGKSYLELAEEFLSNDVIPAVGGIRSSTNPAGVDGLFIDNAYVTLDWVDDVWLGQADAVDSDKDGQADSPELLNARYDTAISAFYDDLRAHNPEMLLVGNGVNPTAVEPLNGRCGEGDGGACAFDSSSCQMATPLRKLRDAPASAPWNIFNLGTTAGFTSAQAAAYAYLLGDLAFVALDDGSDHNVATAIPPEYSDYASIGAPLGAMEDVTNVFYRRYENGVVVANGATVDAIVTVGSGTPTTLAPGDAKLLLGATGPLSIAIARCEFALSAQSGAQILQLETDAVCGTTDCGDGWWSSLTDGGGTVPETIEVVPRQAPYQLNAKLSTGQWATDPPSVPILLDSYPLTNIVPIPYPPGAQNFVFRVAADCSIIDDG